LENASRISVCVEENRPFLGNPLPHRGLQIKADQEKGTGVFCAKFTRLWRAPEGPFRQNTPVPFSPFGPKKRLRATASGGVWPFFYGMVLAPDLYDAASAAFPPRKRRVDRGF
jgi:hypothetical protein